jgi:hypothetical protein
MLSQNQNIKLADFDSQRMKGSVVNAGYYAAPSRFFAARQRPSIVVFDAAVFLRAMSSPL